jgi:xanthine dehydrogenase YagR molybdenum-binding subunit
MATTMDRTIFGRPTPRIDGAAKVTGAARYPSDEPVSNPAFAWLVTSTIARGRVTGFDLEAAKATPGVLEILTHENIDWPVQPQPGFDGSPTTTTLESDQVWHDGQIIAIVVADSFEIAREAAGRIGVRYDGEQPAGIFDAAGADTERLKAGLLSIGDAATAFQQAPFKVEQWYETPTQHHNAMELYTATCLWEGEKLTVYEPSQTMTGSRARLAAQLGIDRDDIRVISRFVGGAFGAKAINGHTAWIAIAAKRIGRPVKLVTPRDQGFSTGPYRAESRHHVRLSAAPNGKLTSYFHEGWEMNSRASSFATAGVAATAQIYACPNIETAANVVKADRNAAGFMRAPPETPFMFALESALDELAEKLDIDPVELRRINDTQTDPTGSLDFSSRSLMQCYDQAADRFGWHARDRKPGSMRDGEWLVGYGCASACFPAIIGPAAARLVLSNEGKVEVRLAGHDLGTGAYTVVAIAAARSLGLEVTDVSVVMGDSDLPPVVVAGGSNNAASTAHVVTKAGEEVRRRLAEAAVAANDSPFHGLDPDALRLESGLLVGPGNAREQITRAVARVGGSIEIYAEHVPEGLPPDSIERTRQGQVLMLGGRARKDVIGYAFGAQFVEVRVHSRTREIRVARTVSAFAAGTIINPTAAHSQLMGGVIWGISSALHEATEVDPRKARYINDNFADYMIPVNADVPSIEVIMVPEEDDRINPLGIKGVGEVGIVGMNAAIANAVYHATGTRIRELPIRPEKLL